MSFPEKHIAHLDAPGSNANPGCLEVYEIAAKRAGEAATTQSRRTVAGEWKKLSGMTVFRCMIQQCDVRAMLRV